MRTLRDTVKDWVRVLPFCLFILLPLTSCSESDDTVEEYADWQNRNEQYFESIYAKYTPVVKWSVTSSEVHTDHILVEVLEEGAGTDSPLYTDSVSVHYRGRLLPSPSYAEGYVFDQSYQGTFDADINVPSRFLVSGLVDGFSTALMHMHKGDYWRIYIPYQLGYGSSSSSSVPAYSTLIFDVRLEDFWK